MQQQQQQQTDIQTKTVRPTGLHKSRPNCYLVDLQAHPDKRTTQTNTDMV